MNRRSFIKNLCVNAASAPFLKTGLLYCKPEWLDKTIKPIQGTWFGIQYPDLRYKYINPYMIRFTCDEIRLKIKELTELGMEYLVLNAVTLFNKAFYESSVFPRWDLVCIDPVETILASADEYNMSVFLTCEYPWDEDDSITDPELMRIRLRVLNEVAEKFSHHKSFCGWYFAREAFIDPVFSENFLRYLSSLADEARRLTPGAKILIAPYGTWKGTFDDTYLRQLESLPADIIAFQDEVGCVRPDVSPETTARQFEKARRAHDRNGRVALWADVETFTWEGSPNSRTSALVPAAFPRILAQMRAVSPFVDKILVFTAQGIFEKPGTSAPMGHPDAVRLYRRYREFLDRTENSEFLIKAVSGHLNHQGVGKQIILKVQPTPPYSKGNLADGYLPSANYSDNGWLGFHKNSFDVIINMEQSVPIKKLAAHFLQYRRAGIDLPNRVSFEVSDDGLSFVPISHVYPEIWLNAEHDAWTEILVSENLNTKGRYVRVKADCSYELLFIGEVVVNPVV